MTRWVLVALVALGLGAAEPGWRSPVAVLVHGDQAVVAEHDGQRLSVQPLAGGQPRTLVALPSKPTGLVKDGDRLLVTVGELDGALLSVSATGVITGRVALGHTPMAPVPTTDGVWVCERFENRVALVASDLSRVVARVAVARQPVAAALTPDGRTLVVLDHLPYATMGATTVALQVNCIDTANRRRSATISLLNGATSGRGLCLSPDGRFAYVSHVQARYHLPVTHLEGGWVNVNALSVIDVPAARLVATLPLDQASQGAANPWAIACDQQRLVVSTAGSGEVHFIDRPGLHQRLARSSQVDQSDRFALLDGLRRRQRTGLDGLRSLTLQADGVLVASYFDDALALVRPGATPRILRLGQTEDTPERRGERLFTSAAQCFQGWQSCSTCHPDGRNDALSWDLLNDGIGNPKQTKNMLGAMYTAPSMALGVRTSATVAIRAGFHHSEFTEVSEVDARAVEAYLAAMRPIASPHPANARGQDLFNGKADCVSCHAGPWYTDRRKHDLGTGTGQDAGKAFDTPTLVEVWRTAPYLHDGRALTVRDLLELGHGDAAGLSAAERDDLAAHVLSLSTIGVRDKW